MKQAGPTARVATMLLLTAAGLALPAEAAAQEARIGIARGATPAPVRLETIAGDEVDLAEYFGRVPVLLEFWATWCENCEALQPRILEAHDLYGDRVQFFAVAVAVGQSLRRIRGHLEEHPAPYPTLWDERGAAVRAFEVPATSYIVILGRDGRVAYTGLGRDQDPVDAVRVVLAADQNR